MSCRMILPSGGGAGVTFLCFYGPGSAFPEGTLSAHGVGVYASLANEGGYQYPAPRAGVLRNLRVHAEPTSTGVAGSYYVRVNGADTALTCAMGAELVSDLVHTVTVAAGDLISMQQRGNNGSPDDICVSLEFVG